MEYPKFEGEAPNPDPDINPAPSSLPDAEHDMGIDNEFPASPAAEPAPTPKKSQKAKIIIIAAVALLAAIITGACFALFNGNSPKKVAERFFISYAAADYKKIDSCQLKGGVEYHKFLAKEKGMELDKYYEHLTKNEASNYKEFCEYMDGKLEETLKEKYGKSIEITVKVKSEEKLSKEELKDLKKDFENDGFIDPDKITEGKKLEIKARIKGPDGSGVEADTYVFVKYKGKWKIVRAA